MLASEPVGGRSRATKLPCSQLFVARKLIVSPVRMYLGGGGGGDTLMQLLKENPYHVIGLLPYFRLIKVRGLLGSKMNPV